MKMTKEVEQKFFDEFAALMNKYGVKYDVFMSTYGRGNVVLIHARYHSDWVDEEPVKIVSTPDHKIVRGCDGGGYLEVKVHE